MNYKFDFVQHRKIFFSFSIIITILGFLTLAIFNMNYGVDFKAGTSLDITLDQTVTQSKANNMIKTAIGFSPASTVVGGTNNTRVSTRFDKVLSQKERDAVIAQFKKDYKKVDAEENTVDVTLAKELRNKAIIAVLVASLGIVVYVTIRFDWRFAIAAIVSLLHDAFIVISVFSIFRLEVNLPFLAAVLTIIGYSINDTIVIFDRIRENMRFAKLKKPEDIAELVNRSIWQTMTRSINTVLTVVFGALCIFVFGGESIRLFALAMIIGLVSGAYSSVCIASQLWYLFKKGSLNRKKAVPAAK